jgi:hypothetical protein
LPAASLKIVVTRAMRPASTSVINELALSHPIATRGLHNGVADPKII